MISLALMACASLTPALHAQTVAPPAPAATKPDQTSGDAAYLARRNRDTGLDPMRVYRLQAGSGPNYGNEILTALRLMLEPICKVYIDPELQVILVRCDEMNLLIADRLMRELDRVKPNYRLTYTVVESDNGKRIGVQHFALTMIPGVRTTLKDGSKVPVATGSYSAGAAQAGVQTQFTYLDVGLNFDATLVPGADGMRLESKVEQSSTAEERTISGINEPIVRQAVLQGSTTLQVGKPVMLGTLDVAASTHHLEIEALLELIK